MLEYRNTSSLGEPLLPGQIRLRCAMCGCYSFGDGSAEIRVAGMPANGPPGMLCERCVTAADRNPRMMEGIKLAIRAGVVLADLVRGRRS